MATTTEKKLTYLQETKNAIKNALISKGQTVTSSDTFRSYADKVRAIYTGDYTLLDNVPIELDFANGDMSFTAPDGYAVKSAIVKKPTTLTPENVAEGVVIAGIVGTHTGGGTSAGEVSLPGLFTVSLAKNYLRKPTSGGISTVEETMELPLGCQIHTVQYYNGTTNIVNGSGVTSTFPAKYDGDYTLVEDEGSLKLTIISYRLSVANSYISNAVSFIVMLTLPGFSIGQDVDGVYRLRADGTVTELVKGAYPVMPVQRIDLSESQITTLPEYLTSTAVKEVLLPATVTTIPARSLSNPGITLIDLSRCTSVPAVTYNYNSDDLYSSSFSYSEDLEIRVPAALYDAIMADRAWANWADNIVAV